MLQMLIYIELRQKEQETEASAPSSPDYTSRIAFSAVQTRQVLLYLDIDCPCLRPRMLSTGYSS